MAINKIDSKKRGGKTAGGSGENRSNPTQAGRPTGATYKMPHMFRGMIVHDRSDGGSDTHYGENGNAVPASVDVEQSATLTDFEISPQGGDPVRASLIKNGFGDSSGAADNAVGDLNRKISTEGYPTGHGMKNPNNPAEKVPSKINASVQPGPVRRP